MVTRLQIFITPEALKTLETVIEEANKNFTAGKINYSHAITEMILTSKIDIKALQLKHTDWRRSLKSMAAKEDLDLETAIKNLTELKASITKKKNKTVQEEMPV